MEELWRMRMEMLTPSSPPPPPTLLNYTPRRSTCTSHRQKHLADEYSEDDLTDVFGGSPRTILSRQFSSSRMPGSSASPSFIYEEMFSPMEKQMSVVRKGGRSLREFRIPGQRRMSERNNQHSSWENISADFRRTDIHRCNGERVLMRSRSRSMLSTTSSLSVLSSEELTSPPQQLGGHDLSLLASKLRQINVRNRWNSTKEGLEDQYESPNDYHLGKYDPRNPSRGNTTILETISNGSFRMSGDDLDQLNSLSSPVSSVFRKTPEIEEESLWQSEDDDEVMSSSYFFQINDDNKECGSNGVDEAIAWVKESFQTPYSKERSTCSSTSSPSTGKYGGY